MCAPSARHAAGGFSFVWIDIEQLSKSSDRDLPDPLAVAAKLTGW